MPRGAPDYSNVRVGAPIHRVTDLAEIPARLGSPVTHDRGGNIVFIDSFEYGLAPWLSTSGATGGSVVLTAEAHRTYNFCVKVTSGSGENEASQLYRKFPYPTLNKYGLEFSVMLGSTVKHLIWTFALRDGDNENQYQCMYTPADKEIVVTIPGGSSIAVIEDITLEVGSGLFHTIKLIADFENGEYVRLIVNEQVVDLSAYGPYTFVEPSNKYLGVTFTLYGNTGDNDYVYIDDVIVTQNES